MRIPGRKSYNGAYYSKGANKLRSLYKGRLITITETGYFETLARLDAMQKAGLDISPVFQDVILAFKSNMQSRFLGRQSPDVPPQRWVSLSKRYAKSKFKAIGKRIADLVYSGRLKSAVFGGPGWYEKIAPRSAEWGIKGIPYAAAHQYGNPKNNLPQRNFFLPKSGGLPVYVKQYMIGRVKTYLRGEG